MKKNTNRLIYREARIEDIDAIVRLHRRFHVDSVADEDRPDGFVTTDFTPELLRRLIQEERGLFVAMDGNRVAAYVMSASWEFCAQWPIFVEMIATLPQLEYRGCALSVENSYQYGPVCVDTPYRGTEVLPGIFGFALERMARRYEILVTFVNRQNPRSFAAHTRRLGLEVIGEFEFGGNRYWELACLTRPDHPRLSKE